MAARSYASAASLGVCRTCQSFEVCHQS
jgi:hypothetical protein